MGAWSISRPRAGDRGGRGRRRVPTYALARWCCINRPNRGALKLHLHAFVINSLLLRLMMRPPAQIHEAPTIALQKAEVRYAADLAEASACTPLTCT